MFFSQLRREEFKELFIHSASTFHYVVIKEHHNEILHWP